MSGREQSGGSNPCAGKTEPANALPRGPRHEGRPTPARPRKSKNSRRRATVLVLVHLVIVAHITQWLLTGQTVSPVEPSESMETLELGRVNAGFVFFCVAIVSTAVFGRFFCGWGCHIVALQDLCGAWMKRIGIRPRLFRSRFLRLAPLVIFLYMFVWPSFKRSALLPLLSVVWPTALAWFTPVPPFPGFSSHLMVSDFWATFATWAAIPFLLVCGFLTVYFLGAKGFCTYGCPYGAIFGVADRIAPGQILADLNTCEKCGHCTATCTSNVPVHQEIQIYGKVTNSGCMKCLDCVSVCPTGALSYGYSRPQLWTRRLPGSSAVKNRYDVTVGGEFLLALLALGVFWSVRGIYDFVPMLMAVGIAACMTFMTWKLLRLLRDREVRLHRFTLTRQGKVAPAGWVFAAATGCGLSLALHSAAVKLNLRLGDRFDRRVLVTEARVFQPSPPKLAAAEHNAAATALKYYRRAKAFWQGGWGLWITRGIDGTHALDDRIAWLHLVLGEREPAELALRAAVDICGATNSRTHNLARILLLQGKTAEARAYLEQTLGTYPDFSMTRSLLAGLLIEEDRIADAERLLAEVLDPDQVHTRVGRRWITGGRPAEGEAYLRSVLASHPHYQSVREELAAFYLGSQRNEDALALYEDALARNPDDARNRALRAVNIYLRTNRAGEAIRELHRAIRDDPDNPRIRRDLAGALLKAGAAASAIATFADACRLAPEDFALMHEFAHLLEQLGKHREAHEWRRKARRTQVRSASARH